MLILSGSMQWRSLARALALLVALVLSLELGFPINSQAQTSQPQTSTSVTDIKNQNLPPMQEVEIIQERKPFYKKWWFWTLVGVAVAGGAVGAMAIGSGGSSLNTGSVTVTGPNPTN